MKSKKRVLITGINSYIGNSFRDWIITREEDLEITAISVRNDDWREMDFSKFDSILHVAGIAHVSADPELESLYYKINRDLAIDIAEKAKSEGADHFVFMSSIIIYGRDSRVGETKVISFETNPSPVDFYGKSKLEADLAIGRLEDSKFKISIVRTPMVYGPKCKGNFPRLIKIAKKSFLFPSINNERSMIYIDNLTEFLRIVIKEGHNGIFYPQNEEYVSTKEIIKIMAESMSKPLHFTGIFNPILKLVSRKVNIINKIWGGKVYSKDTLPNFEYQVVDFKSSIIKSMSLGG